MRLVRLVSFVISLSWLAGSVRAAEIKHLNGWWNSGSVSVSFTLERAFDDEQIRQALQSGLPTGFTYHVELIRKRPNWFDDTLDQKRIEVIATLNSVTREYLLNYRKDRRLVSSETISDFETLEKRMTSIVEEGLFDAKKKTPSKLRVRVRADLQSGYLFHLIPWDVSTDWKEARVKRGPQQPAAVPAHRPPRR